MNKIYKGKVVKIMEFGAFVNFLGKQDGLVHISELADKRVAKVTDVVKEGDEVKVFLLASGVECQTLDKGKFKVTEQMQALLDNGGEILACGTCLDLRGQEGDKLCPLSTMKDLYEIVKESDKVVTF